MASAVLFHCENLRLVEWFGAGQDIWWLYLIQGVQVHNRAFFFCVSSTVLATTVSQRSTRRIHTRGSASTIIPALTNWERTNGNPWSPGTRTGTSSVTFPGSKTACRVRGSDCMLQEPPALRPPARKLHVEWNDPIACCMSRSGTTTDKPFGWKITWPVKEPGCMVHAPTCKPAIRSSYAYQQPSAQQTTPTLVRPRHSCPCHHKIDNTASKVG